MGRRVNYELCGESVTSVILFSNSHHETESPEDAFKAAVTRFGCGVTALTEHLLGLRYSSASGQHRSGDRMFSVDLAPGDREVVLRVDFTVEPPVVAAVSA